MSNISDLRFDDKNMNAHTAKGMGLLEKSLQQFGAGRSILIDKNNRIIGGNGVVEAAGNIGLEDVQIVESDGKKIIAVKRTDIDLDSKEGRELAMADNAVAAEDLSWNNGNIEEVSEQFGIDPGDWISDWDAQAEQEVEEGEAPEVNESEPAKSELGKVYQLGEHRLMCGDSTDAGSVAILMDGQKADMVFTDPPYGISIVGDNGKIGARNLAKNRVYSKVIADDTTETAEKAYKILKTYSNKLIIWGGNYFVDFLDFSDGWIIWDKRGDMNSNNFADGEMAWCSFHTPVRIYKQIWNGMIREGEHENRVHPTQKPIKMLGEILKDFTKDGEIVLDVFGGSGSTLIACEQLGRKCYMMELDPKYCDVIRKRYWKFTHDGNEEGWEKGTPAI